jgi:flagellar basal body rod protein FlgB
MLARLIGSESAVARLKEGLDTSARNVRGIAHRVANAGNAGFSQSLDQAQAAGGGAEGDAVDLEREMVALADEQLRFEAVAGLLQRSYQSLRSTVRER